MVDAQGEPLGLKKGMAIQTSHPKPGVAYYKDIWPSTMFTTAEGERLVMGTQSFDALVTSSVRLYVGGQGSMDAAKGNFQLMSEADATVIRIFLDKEIPRHGCGALLRPICFLHHKQSSLLSAPPTKTRFSCVEACAH